MYVCVSSLKVVSSSQYQTRLESIGILIKARNFLVFQVCIHTYICMNVCSIIIITLTCLYVLCMEGNFGGWKHWRIWRMTINSPKFLQPKYFVQYIIKVQICQSLFRQLCFCSEFAKVCTHQSFPLYGTETCSVLSRVMYVLLEGSLYLRY